MPDPDALDAARYEQAAALVRRYGNNPDYLRMRVRGLFMGQPDAVPLPIPVALRFDIALTEADHRFLRSQRIAPCQ